MLLQARDIRVTLPSLHGDGPILDGVDLDLDAGDFVDVAGASGAGKTTLARALARLMPGATGDLTLEGVSAEQLPVAVWRTRVALLPQQPAIFAGTVRDNLLVPWRLKSRRGETAPVDDQLSAALAEVHLDVELDRDASRLSVGQRARVALLRVMLSQPKVILLDEPDAALDEASAQAVAEMATRFTEQGGAVVRVRHRLADGHASRRIELSAGRANEVTP